MALPRRIDQNAPMDPPRPNPAALAIPDLARILSNAAQRTIAAETIDADVAAGAPTNADGTMNLVHYTAWLILELATRGD